MLGGVASAETWVCKNDRFGELIYEVNKSEIIQKFPNNDFRIFQITKDKRKHNISIFGVFKNKKTNYEFDIYMDYNDKIVILRTLDSTSGFSNSYTDINCSIF